jgi:hypothetical protein
MGAALRQSSLSIIIHYLVTFYEDDAAFPAKIIHILLRGPRFAKDISNTSENTKNKE